MISVVHVYQLTMGATRDQKLVKTLFWMFSDFFQFLTTFYKTWAYCTFYTDFAHCGVGGWGLD